MHAQYRASQTLWLCQLRQIVEFEMELAPP